MHAQPQQEHQWLQQLVGEWDYEHEAVMAPGQPPETFRGKESVRSLGGLWVVCEGRGEMPGHGTAGYLMTLGYDPAKRLYVGTFAGSVMTNLWVYEGELDPSGKVLTLRSTGPSFTAEGKTANYRDVIEIKDENYRTLTSNFQGDDGQWVQFMTAHYRRKK